MVDAVILLLIGTMLSSYCYSAAARSSSSRTPTPVVTSTFLKMHQLYLRQKPHDTTFYDVLEISSNATAAEITKSYRKLIKRFHPDKQRRQHRTQSLNRSSNCSITTTTNTTNTTTTGDTHQDNPRINNHAVDINEKFQRVSEAYTILKNDRTRLLYHRYGLTDTLDAVVLLTGKGAVTKFHNDPDLMELLTLMGLDHNKNTNTKTTTATPHYYNTIPKTYSATAKPTTTTTPNTHTTNSGTVIQQQQQHQPIDSRISYLAAQLIETIRPVVEGVLPESYLIDHIVQQCDRLKRRPMGAQILRCIGRAYRYSGQRTLRQQQQQKGFKQLSFTKSILPLQDSMRDKLRNVKHIATAAVAGGRVVLEERVISSKPMMFNSKAGPFHDPIKESADDSTFSTLDIMEEEDNTIDDDCLDPYSDMMDVKGMEVRHARQAILESLQVEALWKICKIDLDRTIRQACDLILEKGYYFYPSQWTEQRSPLESLYDHSYADGWIGSNGIAVTADIGRTRTASLLIAIGEVMVQQSKEDTAWME